MNTVLFSTPHGSHLYGLATPQSDRDVYVVLADPPRVRRRGKQSIVDGVDTVTIGLSEFLRLCDLGVPQALEAMFSPYPTVDKIAHFRLGYRAGRNAIRTYHRTITSFAHAGDFKRRRHALRLALNAADIARQGWFHPMLYRADVNYINNLAGSSRSAEDLIEIAMKITNRIEET